MNREQAKKLIIETFENPFDKNRFIIFLKNLLKSYEDKSFVYQGNYIPAAFENYVSSLERIGKYTYEDKEIDLLIVNLKKGSSLEQARTTQRNLIAWYLKESISGEPKDAAIVAFVSPDNEDWRFSLVKIDYRFEKTPSGKLKVKEEFTPAKRWSFLVGKNEKSHTAQSRFIHILENDRQKPTLEDLEKAFDVEVVTNEFFSAYKHAVYNIIIPSLDKTKPYDKKHSFAQLLLSRIMFLYFLQRKGWLKWKDYQQDKNYMKNLWLKYKEWKERTQKINKFYSDWLSSLFFGAFNKKSNFISKELPDDIQESFRIMPFLNGGLFSKTELDEIGFDVPDEVFEWLFEPDNKDLRKGFLEIYNFTIDESTPLDVEVAVDPEMIGKVYESLINEEERGEAGVFYTPRIEIDLMCRLSLVNYLKSKTNLAEEKLIDFVFNPQEGVNVFEENELKSIKKFLDDVKILDPAVGSASFLVGMMNVLVQLHLEISRKLENKEENLFALKEKIILNSLYGVDVKDWAVMVGELRLWLSLIIETDEKYMDIYTKPLLPNLSFKIHQGDSLIQEIADVPIDLRNEMLILPKNIRDKINELIDRKFKFFSGMRSADLKELKEIEQFEKEIFKEIIFDKIEKKKKEIEQIEQDIKMIEGQGNLWDKKDQKTESKIEKLLNEKKNLENDIKRYENTLLAIEKNKAKDFFLWEIDFIEVFSLKGGFDIVIGNPPYVRQEMIAPPLLNKNDYDDDKWREIKKEYKEKLLQKVKNLWGINVIDKRSDLYVYFYYQSLSLLCPGGIFCFINSNSWLDVGYGAGLQEFLLKNMEPLMIIDNLKKRSFKQADVNTVIVLIKRPENKPENFTIKFVAFKKTFEDVMKPDVLKRIAKANKPIFDDEDFRIFPKTKDELLLEGVEVDDEEKELYKNLEFKKYIGNKWGGKYLRAPEIYFKILEKGKDKLVRLGDIAEVRFGIKTGANEFFYLKPIGMTVKEVVEISEKDPYALIPVRNGAGWEGEIEAKFLKPVIKSPRELKTIIVRLEDLNHLVFMCHEEKSKLRETNALKYIEWGEKQGFQKRPTCRGREKWWKIEGIIPSFTRGLFINDRFITVINDINAYVDAQLIIPVLKNRIFNSENIVYFLNSSIGNLFLELAGRVSLGQGVLKIQNYEYEEIYVLPIPTIRKEYNVFESIFTELGFDPSKPIRLQEPNPLPDRKALDDIVFDVLGLTEEERKEVYWAVAELVKNRLEKAKSV